MKIDMNLVTLLFNESYLILNTKEITIYGIYASIFLFMALTPFIGFIPIGPFAITTLLIPFIVMSIHLGWKGALIGGLMFGIVSVLYGITYGAPIIAAVGLGKTIVIAVGSRLILGGLIALIITPLKNVNKILKTNIITLTALTINGIAFLGLYAIFAGKEFMFIFTFVSINMAIEWPVVIIIANGIIPLQDALKKNEKLGY